MGGPVSLAGAVEAAEGSADQAEERLEMEDPLRPPRLAKDPLSVFFRQRPDRAERIGSANGFALESSYRPTRNAAARRGRGCPDQRPLRAYRWNQARSPVLPLANGMWVRAYPTILNGLGKPAEFFPGEDNRRSWAYGIEIGAHHLAVNGVLDARSDEAACIVNHMEDVQFLRSGMGDYPEERNREDFFNLGGFAKVQPYYARIAELYAARDDVRPFLRSYFNAAASLLSRENLSFWEHFHNTGAWNKTHETGWFLAQTRIMLLRERGDELWLAPFVTRRWMENGMKLSVRNAPTRFGAVGYAIRSASGRGWIDVRIDPPTGRQPARIVVRVRHPAGKPMRSVTVDGVPYEAFNPSRETVAIDAPAKPVAIRVQY